MNIMKRLLSKKVVAVGLAAGITLGIGGAAFAYFTNTGTGTGNALVGSPTTGSWNVTFGTESGTMFPGYGTSNVPYTITNASSPKAVEGIEAVLATVVSSGGDITVGGTPVAGCLAVWFTANANSGSLLPALTTSLAFGASASGTATVTMLDASGINQDACAAATPDILISAS